MELRGAAGADYPGQLDLDEQGEEMTTFLCTRCRRLMCQDCIDIADEYMELEQNRKRALIAANDKVERLERELKLAESRAKMYEEVAKAGINQIIVAWMDKEIGQLLKGGKR